MGYLLFIFSCIDCTKTLCSRYKEHPDSLLCLCVICVNTLGTLKCSRSLLSSFSPEFLIPFSVTVCTVHPSCLLMKHYHINPLILENIRIMKTYSSCSSSTNNVLQGWKSPCFWWNLETLINDDTFRIILQHSLKPDKLQPPIATKHRFISDTWSLQSQLITIIKTFLSMFLAKKWCCPGAAVLMLWFGYCELGLQPADLKPLVWKANTALPIWFVHGSYICCCIIGFELEPFGLIQWKPVLRLTLIFLTGRKVTSAISDCTCLASSHQMTTQQDHNNQAEALCTYHL